MIELRVLFPFFGRRLPGLGRRWLTGGFAALALLTGPTHAHGQIPELPTFQDLGLEYISETGFFQLLLSGQLDLEGAHRSNGWTPEISSDARECEACHVDLGREMQFGEGRLQTYRLRVFADLFLGDHLYSMLELRSDRGQENFGADPRVRVEQIFVRAVDGSGSRGIQVGRFANPFGAYALRHLSVTDPFVTPPLAYDYRTVMNRWRAPADAEDFLTWKSEPNEVDLPGAPAVWEVAYPWGALLFGRLGPVELRGGAMNSAPSSHPNAWSLTLDGFRRPSWVVSARWAVSASFDVGVSYDRGPWMAPPTTRTVTAPPGAPEVRDWQDFDQELISVDAGFARGPAMIRAEVIRDRWEVPNLDAEPTGLSGSLELQTDLAAGFFAAARLGVIDFRPVEVEAGTSGAQRDWDHDVGRTEAALGYRLTRNAGVLVSGYRQEQTGAPEGDTTFLGLRLWWAF